MSMIGGDDSMVSKSDVSSFWNSSLRFKIEVFIDLSYFSLNSFFTCFNLCSKLFQVLY